MSMSLLEKLANRLPTVHRKLHTYILALDEKTSGLLHQIVEAHFRAEDAGRLKPLNISTAHINGASHALREILRELGNDDELFREREVIQELIRKYLGACGFKRADELLVSNAGSERLLLDRPHDSPRAFQQVFLSMSALQSLLNQIKDGKCTALSDLEALGGFFLCIMLRDGALSLREIKRCVIEFKSGRLARLDDYFYTYGPLGKVGEQSRRLFLSPLTLAFLFRGAKAISHEELKIDLVNKSLLALKKRLEAHETITWGNFKELNFFITRYLRLNLEMTQHVVDYMSGDLESTSLTESCWAPIMGYEACDELLIHEREARELRTREAQKPKVLRPSFIKKISAALNEKPHATAKASTDALLSPVIDGRSPQPALIKQLASFVDWMIKVNGLKSSTCRMHLENLSQVLFPMVSTLDQAIESPYQWEAMIENMLRDETAYSKSIDAVTKFSDFLTRTLGDNYKPVGFSAAASVNAHIITHAQKGILTERIKNMLGRDDRLMTDIAIYLVELAYGLGARRWELIGLHFNDVLGPREPLVRFVKNQSRDLKTDSSVRQLSLKHLMNEPFYESWQEFIAKAKERDEDAGNIIEASGFDLQRYESKMFKVISRSLTEASGLKEVSFHSLRHTAACRFLLAIYWHDLSLQSFTKYGYFKEIDLCANDIKASLIRKNTANFLEHKTVSAFLGHLTFRTTAAHYFHFYCILRLGLMQQIRQKSELADDENYLSAVSGVPNSLLTGLSVPDQVALIASHLKQSLISVSSPYQPDTQLILATDGEEHRETLSLLADLVLDPSNPNLDRALAKKIPIPHARSQFLSSLLDRSNALIALQKKVGLLKTTNKERGRFLEDERLIFQMPSNMATQSAIGAILSEIERLYPERDELRSLANSFYDALGCMSRRDFETFCFKPDQDVAVVLGPIQSILQRSKTHICYWHRTKERVLVKKKLEICPRDVNHAKQWTQDLAAIPRIKKGQMLVRFEAIDHDENFKPGVLIWVITVMCLAYGTDYYKKFP